MAKILLRGTIIFAIMVAIGLAAGLLIRKSLMWIWLRFGDTTLIITVSAIFLWGIIEYFVKLYRKKNQQNF
jgi:hypothetical protein